jgi:hypothetical protein
VARGPAEVREPSPTDPTRTRQPDRPADSTRTGQPDPLAASSVRPARPLSVAAAVLLAGAGTAVYIRNIAVARDRADAALAQVEAARARLSHEHAELTLKHAELLLATDPTATIDALATYG